MTKPEDIAAEKAVFAFEARIQGGEFEGLDPNGTDARDALKAEIRKAILSAVEEEREACAEVARNWLHNWANDLVDTRDSYIEAKSTGKHNGRRMGREDADFYAKQFRERADAVSDCVEHVASAIRNRKES